MANTCTTPDSEPIMYLCPRMTDNLPGPPESLKLSRIDGRLKIKVITQLLSATLIYNVEPTFYVITSEVTTKVRLELGKHLRRLFNRMSNEAL